MGVLHSARRTGRQIELRCARPDVLGLAAVILITILGNLLPLSGTTDPNPILVDSGLGVHVGRGTVAGLDHLDPNIGITAQALGHRAALDVVHGHVPLWNPYEGIGAPLLGEMQSAALYLPTLFTLLSDGQIYFRLTLEFTAGIATFLLLRRLRIGAAVASIGGGAFALNGTFAWLFHAPGNPIALLPLLLLGIEWARDASLARSSRRGSWILIGVAVALSLYAGFPETAFIDLLLAGLWAVVRMVTLPAADRRTFAGPLAAGGTLGVALMAPIVVAFVDYVRYADVAGHAGGLARAHLPRYGAPQVIMPYIYGSLFRNSTPKIAAIWNSVGGYLTGSLAVLAAAGLPGRRMRSLRLVLGAWVVLSLLRIYGYGPAITLFNLVPGLRDVAFYRYAQPSVALAVTVLACLAIDDAVNRRLDWRWVLGVAAGFLVLVGWGHRVAVHALAHSNYAVVRGWTRFATTWAVLVLAIACIGLLLTPRRRRTGLTVVGVVVAIDALVSFAIPQLSSPRRGTIDMRPVTFLRSHLGVARYFELGPVAPDYGSYFGLASVTINDLPIPSAYGKYIHAALNPKANPPTFGGAIPTAKVGGAEFLAHLPGFEGIAVKYVVVNHGYRFPSAPEAYGLRLAFSDTRADIYSTPHPQPFASAPGCSVVPSGWYDLTTQCATASQLTRTELYLPGWSAQIGSSTVPVHAVRGLFQEIPVPAGASTIHFSYSPPHFVLAEAVAVAGLLSVAGAFVVPAMRGRRRRTDQADLW